MGLWSEVVARFRGLNDRVARSKSKRVSPEALRRSNVLRARQAVEEGQYRNFALLSAVCGRAPYLKINFADIWLENQYVYVTVYAKTNHMSAKLILR